MGAPLVYRPQAAVVAVYQGRVCLVTSRSRKRWVVPKGCMEDDMTPGEVALQEAWEEAGLLGTFRPEPLGTYRYEKAGCRYRVTVFLMDVAEVRRSFPEAHERTRSWLKLERAIELVEEPGLRKLLQKAFSTEGIAVTV